MANEQNLMPIKKGQLSKEEAKKRGSNGGKKSAESKKKNILFKKEIEKQLGDSLENIIQSAINQAKKGNIKAMEFLRDTSGQKPIEQFQEIAPPKIEDDI